jgi:hypothetical protein
MMQKWKKVGYWAGGIVYASGNIRKVIMPRKPDIYFEMDTNKVWWNQDTRNDGLVESIKRK